MVCPASPTSYFPFAAIWEVPVFPATSYPSTHHFFANPIFAPSVSIAIIFLEVSSLITRRSGVGVFLTTVPSASVRLSTIYGCIYIHPLAKAEYAEAIWRTVAVIPCQNAIVKSFTRAHFS